MDDMTDLVWAVAQNWYYVIPFGDIIGEHQVIAVQNTRDYKAELIRADVSQVRLEEWTYDSLVAAMAALNTWQAAGLRGEPVGWVSHQTN